MMVQRRVLSTAVIVLVTFLILAAGAFGVSTLRDAQPVLLAMKVPKNYSGWLVISWNCTGGERLADSLVNGRRYEPEFSADGTLCLIDDVPEHGYAVVDYRFVSGPDDGNADDGQAFVASPFLRTGPSVVRPDHLATSTIAPAVADSGNHKYDIAWVEVIEHRNDDDRPAFPVDDLRLGDRCDLDSFMQERFAESSTATTCGPIPTRQQADLTE